MDTKNLNGRKTIEFRTPISTNVAQLVAFHENPLSFRKLIPPPLFIQILRDDRTSLQAGEIEFNLWFGPVPIRWLAQHKPGPTQHSFTDRMVSGPMGYWNHEHIFNETSSGVTLVDRITLEHQPGLRGWFTRLFFDGLALKMLFTYRHLRTKWELRK